MEQAEDVNRGDRWEAADQWRAWQDSNLRPTD